MKNYGERFWLKALRENLGLTQGETAKCLNISVSHYQRIEYGRRDPSPAIAKKLAVLFGFPMERLYEPMQASSAATRFI